MATFIQAEGNDIRNISNGFVFSIAITRGKKMITARVVKTGEDLELCYVEVHENGEWVETSRSGSMEEFQERIREFREEYLLRRGEKER